MRLTAIIAAVLFSGLITGGGLAADEVKKVELTDQELDVVTAGVMAPGGSNPDSILQAFSVQLFSRLRTSQIGTLVVQNGLDIDFSNGSQTGSVTYGNTNVLTFSFKPLTINGAPVGRELGKYYLKDELASAAMGGCNRQNSPIPPNPRPCNPNTPDGSIIIVIATDAPVEARNLSRMAARAMLGLARTGAAGSNGSGDYAIAFSTSTDLRIQTSSEPATRNLPRNFKVLPNDSMSPLFLAVIEATEEAIYNSLFRATTTTGRGHRVEALPLDRTLEILRSHKAL